MKCAYFVFAILTFSPACSKASEKHNNYEISQPHYLESQISFDRIHMTKSKNGFVEGYWAQSEDNKDDPFPWPIPHMDNFSHKEEFVRKLMDLENSDKVDTVFYKGFSECRFGDLDTNGTKEFTMNFKGIKIIWPEGYLHYISNTQIVLKNLIFSEKK